MSQLCWVSKPPCRSVAQIPTWHISIQLHPSHNFTLLSFHPVFGLLVLNLRRYVFICLVFPHCGLSADYMSWPLQTWSAAGMRTGHIIPWFFFIISHSKTSQMKQERNWKTQMLRCGSDYVIYSAWKSCFCMGHNQKEANVHTCIINTTMALSTIVSVRGHSNRGDFHINSAKSTAS